MRKGLKGLIEDRKDHIIKKWSNNQDIDNPDGSDPVWINGVPETDPVCYTKNISPTMFAKFTVQPSVPDPGVSGVSIRAKVNDTIIGSASNCRFRATAIEDSSNTDGDVDRIGGGSAISGSNGVKMLKPTFTWEISCDGIDWFPIGSSGPHKMYFIDSGPKTDTLYDLGLKKACEYVNGDPNIAEKINSRLAADLIYNPGRNAHYHDLKIFDENITTVCCCNAIAFRNLIQHVTNDSPTIKYAWGGVNRVEDPDGLGIFTPIEVRMFFRYRGSRCTFQCDSVSDDEKDVVENCPHFMVHVAAEYKGIIYDPSYGKIGWPKLIEFAPEYRTDHYYFPPASEQYGSSLPAAIFNTDVPCVHNDPNIEVCPDPDEQP